MSAPTLCPGRGLLPEEIDDDGNTGKCPACEREHLSLAYINGEPRVRAHYTTPPTAQPTVALTREDYATVGRALLAAREVVLEALSVQLYGDDGADTRALDLLDTAIAIMENDGIPSN